MTQWLEKAQNYLVPPGNGIYTTHQIANSKFDYWKTIYNCHSLSEVKTAWWESLNKKSHPEEVFLLGIPTDVGAGIIKGSNWGPIAIRNQLDNFHRFKDLGDIKCVPHIISDHHLSEELKRKIGKALYSNPSGLAVSPLSITEDFCHTFFSELPQSKIFALGGDNSISYPLIKAWLKKETDRNNRCAILHFDAHTDLMDHRLGVDLTFGSWAKHVLDLMETKNHFIQVGTRQSHHTKKHWEENFHLKQFWADEIITNKLFSQDVLEHLDSIKPDVIYITIDIDVLDQTYAGANGSPEPGGLLPHHIITLIEEVANRYKITGADLNEVSPYIHNHNLRNINPEPETTLLCSKLISQKLIEALCL